MSAEDKKTGDPSAPTIEELDSAWDEHGEEFDEDATTVQRIPKELVALSRRGTEIEQPAAKAEAPEKHEAITARPPPGPVEPSMVIDAPHEELPQAPDLSSPVDLDDDDEEMDEGDEPDEPDVEAIDNEWGEIEERAAAADAAAGLSPEARKQAAEKRAAARKEKARAKTLAAKEKRRAHVDSQRMKAKKPKRRTSSLPPKEDREASTERRPKPSVPPKQGERNSGRPAPMATASASPVVTPKNDVLRMVFLVAIVVLVGAFVIGLARR